MDSNSTTAALRLLSGPAGLNGSFNTAPIPASSFLWLPV